MSKTLSNRSYKLFKQKSEKISLFSKIRIMLNYRSRKTLIPHILSTQRIIVEEVRAPKLKKINQYILRFKLGSGSSAKVYLAQDESTGACYAAKAVQVSSSYNRYNYGEYQENMGNFRNKSYDNFHLYASNNHHNNCDDEIPTENDSNSDDNIDNDKNKCSNSNFGLKRSFYGSLGCNTIGNHLGGVLDNNDNNSKNFYGFPNQQRPNDSCSAAGLEREIRIMRQLNHPNIVCLHDVLYASSVDTAYMFIEWADCGTLQDAINRGNQNSYSKGYIDGKYCCMFDEKTFATIFKQVIHGLSYLHSKSIVHKDIKPSNILLFSYGSAKLADFGIGHSFQSAEAVVGSPAYQAPEMFDDEEECEEEIDPTKGDIWSLGVSLYEAAFGTLPYSGNNLYEIVRLIYSSELKIPKNHSFSNLLIDLIKKLLTVDQGKRPTLEEVLEHDFFKQAVDTPNFHELHAMMNARIPKPPTPDVKISKVSAVVCNENFSFASEFRSFSCPGCFPVIPELNSSTTIEKASSLGKVDHI
ncbi:hypothetical protein TRFO_18083 [Tritrichomonas foetus]|uniref:Protein kinase domain-containing protein n=1 Tax=Tritrichomonas foetus TaxID=1144522 RepID=A0A1J4KRU7_9EUKA|nr:hypothetical protein TRFO_18083 [Tritrichomonas foetus]|eukprot:OHT12189.1 hypothetical protein TRFO_18083 [Tritrichomonas foetus]